ncbi:MAG: helix-turn-helix domain-containing protein [Anaerostipes sp.]
MDYQSYLSHNVAVNLKRIRTSKGMSLDVLSEQTGVSKSMLAQIEKGTANPSLGVLGKITSGLRIEFQELIRSSTNGILSRNTRSDDSNKRNDWRIQSMDLLSI